MANSVRTKKTKLKVFLESRSMGRFKYSKKKRRERERERKEHKTILTIYNEPLKVGGFIKFTSNNN